MCSELKGDTFLADLRDRGLLKQVTSDMEEPKFSTLPVLYVGFDPSAGSLHAGSLIPLLSMDRFRRRGGQIIVVLGGATGLIGDPSGKDHERTLESASVVEKRIESLQSQIMTFFARTDGPEPIIENNASWIGRMSAITLLRDVGKNFSVNQMLLRDSVKSRIDGREQGISYTEFSYQILQSYDFLELHKRYNCTIQMGASDQWGNIVSGVDLVRRMTGSKVDGITLPLLTNSEGRKYGKSEKGAIWLDENLTSAYTFYQFWYNIPDEEAPKLLMWLTDLDAEEIKSLQMESSSLRALQKKLAFEVTSRVHGAKSAYLVQKASEVLFANSLVKPDPEIFRVLEGAIPSHHLEAREQASVADVLHQMRVASSKSDARRLIAQRAVSVNGQVVSGGDEVWHIYQPTPSPVLVAIGKNRRYIVS